MRNLSFGISAVAIAIGLVIGGCGGGKCTKTGTRGGEYPATTASGGTRQSGNATGMTQPVPATLHCGAVAPVWANTKTKVYHVSSDPLYGRTKHGEYMCPQTAASEGYHESKAGAM